MYRFSNIFRITIKIASCFVILSLLSNAWAAHCSEDDLDRSTNYVISLHISTKGDQYPEVTPNIIMNYNHSMRERGWKLHNSSHLKMATGETKVLIAQSKKFLKSGIRFDDSPPVTCRDLQSSLAPMVSSAEFVSFMKKHRLDPDMLTVPKMCQTVYERLTDDKEVFSDILEAYRDPSRSLYLIAGGSLVSLLSITLKIKHPRVLQKLVVFGDIPDYTHDFLSALRIPYENYSSVKKGFPEHYDRFMNKYS